MRYLNGENPIYRPSCQENLLGHTKCLDTALSSSSLNAITTPGIPIKVPDQEFSAKRRASTSEQSSSKSTIGKSLKFKVQKYYSPGSPLRCLRLFGIRNLNPVCAKSQSFPPTQRQRMNWIAEPRQMVLIQP